MVGWGFVCNFHPSLSFSFTLLVCCGRKIEIAIRRFFVFLRSKKTASLFPYRFSSRRPRQRPRMCSWGDKLAFFFFFFFVYPAKSKWSVLLFCFLLRFPPLLTLFDPVLKSRFPYKSRLGEPAKRNEEKESGSINEGFKLEVTARGFCSFSEPPLTYETMDRNGIMFACTRSEAKLWASLFVLIIN